LREAYDSNVSKGPCGRWLTKLPAARALSSCAPGRHEKFQTAPYWSDYSRSIEYFHGDNGAGIGASLQTGRMGVSTWLLTSLAILDPKKVLEKGFDAAALKIIPSDR
jgi:hypothetical protein